MNIVGSQMAVIAAAASSLTSPSPFSIVNPGCHAELECPGILFDVPIFGKVSRSQVRGTKPNAAC